MYSTSVLAKVTFHSREKALPSLTLLMLGAHFCLLCMARIALQSVARVNQKMVVERMSLERLEKDVPIRQKTGL